MSRVCSFAVFINYLILNYLRLNYFLITYIRPVWTSLLTAFCIILSTWLYNNFGQGDTKGLGPPQDTKTHIQGSYITTYTHNIVTEQIKIIFTKQNT